MVFDNHTYCGTADGLLVLSKSNEKLYLKGVEINSLALNLEKRELIIGAENGLFLFDLNTKQITKSKLSQEYEFPLVKKIITTKDRFFLLLANQGILSYKNENEYTSFIIDHSIQNVFEQGDRLFLLKNKALKIFSISENRILNQLSGSDGFRAQDVIHLYGLNKGVFVVSSKAIGVVSEINNNKTQNYKLSITQIEGSFESINGVLTSELKNNFLSFELEHTPVVVSLDGFQIKYRIKELSRDWKSIDFNKEKAKFTYYYLPSGTYSFEAYLIDDKGNISETISLQFTINKSQEPSWWLIGLILTALSLLVLGVLYRRKSKTKQTA